MATRKSPATSAKPAAKAPAKRARKKKAAKKSAPKAAARPSAAFAGFAAPQMPDLAEMGKMAKMLTPEQAIDLYKSNAKLALDVINAAIENTAKLRKKQFEGEEEARDFGRRHAKTVGEAKDPQSLMAASQGAAREAVETSMRYWSEMFDLIVEMQKRIFVLMDDQIADVPGVKEAKQAMAMLPDFRQMKNVVSAMQGVVSSGGNAFDTMQRVMGDFAKLAQGGMGGPRR